MSGDLTSYAVTGFNAAADATSPHLWTADTDAAWRIGHWLRWRIGKTKAPVGVRASRGSTYHVNSMKARIIYAGGGIVSIGWTP